MKANFEAFVPGLAELRAAERLNRARAFAGLTHTLCGVELRSLTPRHRLTLQLMRNAFAAERVEALEGDVFTFLWVLSPNYCGSRGPVALLRQALLRRRVRRLALAIARAEIRDYLATQLQDLPESSMGDGADHSPWVHWIAMDASWWLNVHGGFTLAEYYSTPYLVLQQLFRGWRVNNPDVSFDSRGNAIVKEPQFINASDQLVGRWTRQFREDAAAVLRAQTFRID